MASVFKHFKNKSLHWYGNFVFIISSLIFIVLTFYVFQYNQNLYNKSDKETAQKILKDITPFIKTLLGNKTALKQALEEFQKQNEIIPYVLIEKDNQYYLHAGNFNEHGLSKKPKQITKFIDDDSYMITLNYFVPKHEYLPFSYIIMFFLLYVIVFIYLFSRRVEIIKKIHEKLFKKVNNQEHLSYDDNVITSVNKLIEKNNDYEKKIRDMEAFFNKQFEIKTASLINEINHRKSVEKSLEKSLEEKVIMLKEIHHRVKNNMAIITGLIRMQARTIDNEHIKEIFLDLQNRIKTMEIIHTILYSSKNFANIDFKDYVLRLLENINSSYKNDKIKTIVNSNDIKLSIAESITCGQIINELITNSYKYAFDKEDEGAITITLYLQNNIYTLFIGDNGKGIKKGRKKPSSVGISLVKDLIKYQLKGTMEISTQNGLEYKIEFIKKEKKL